jgi:hypothetical protein
MSSTLRINKKMVYSIHHVNLRSYCLASRQLALSGWFVTSATGEHTHISSRDAPMFVQHHKAELAIEHFTSTVAKQRFESASLSHCHG